MTATQNEVELSYHIIISSYHHIIISSYHHHIIIISSYHHIIISSYHHIIISSYHHIIISSYQCASYFFWQLLLRQLQLLPVTPSYSQSIRLLTCIWLVSQLPGILNYTVFDFLQSFDNINEVQSKEKIKTLGEHVSIARQHKVVQNKVCI